MPLLPFSIISYGTNNPLWVQPQQTVNIPPVPGFSAQSYSISGSLPVGLSFNTSTGVISGTPTTLTPSATLVITATLAGGATTSCNFIVTVTDEPPEAIVANSASAVGLTDSKLIAQQNFISSTEAIINNNNQLGKYTATVELSNYISMIWAYNYLTSLNYSVVNLSPSQNDFEFASQFGQFPSFPGPWNSLYAGQSEDFTQPVPLVRSKPPRKLLLSWTPFVGYQSLPWPVPPFYGPN